MVDKKTLEGSELAKRQMYELGMRYLTSHDETIPEQIATLSSSILDESVAKTIRKDSKDLRAEERQFEVEEDDADYSKLSAADLAQKIKDGAIKKDHLVLWHRKNTLGKLKKINARVLKIRKELDLTLKTNQKLKTLFDTDLALLNDVVSGWQKRKGTLNEAEIKGVHIQSSKKLSHLQLILIIKDLEEKIESLAK